MNSHYFWAIRVPDNIKHRLTLEMEKVKDVFAFNRWVHMNDYHITLAFLGASEQEKLEASIHNIKLALEATASFPLYIQGLNVFGSLAMPRILWASVSDDNRLFQLQSLVQQGCVEVGFILESRAYRPHLTLARKWDHQKPFEAEWLHNKNPFQPPWLFQVEEIVLYKSHVEQTPKYEQIFTISLIK